MNKSVALLIALPALGFVIYQLFFNTKEAPETKPPIAITFAPANPRPIQNNQAAAPIDMSKDPINSQLTLSTTNEAFNEFDAINRLSDKAKHVLINAKVLPTDLHNEAYIEFDLDSLHALKSGDNFDLAIPQTAETYTAEITNVIESGNGDKSIFGRVIGVDGQMHNTVLTVGKDAVYGQFTAPTGNYVFESKGQYGWIAAKRDLYKNHIEYDVGTPKPKTTKGVDVFAPKPDL
jgi:hypothetical protein